MHFIFKRLVKNRYLFEWKSLSGYQTIKRCVSPISEPRTISVEICYLLTSCAGFVEYLSAFLNPRPRHFSRIRIALSFKIICIFCFLLDAPGQKSRNSGESSKICKSSRLRFYQGKQKIKIESKLFLESDASNNARNIRLRP